MPQLSMRISPQHLEAPSRIVATREYRVPVPCPHCHRHWQDVVPNSARSRHSDIRDPIHKPTQRVIQERRKTSCPRHARKKLWSDRGLLPPHTPALMVA